VAVGYLCGTLVIAGIPIALVWRRDGHRWGGVAVRVGLGIGWALALMAAKASVDLGAGLDLLWAAVFLLGWLGLVWPEMKGVRRMLLPLLGRRAQP
jgi:putative peptidoglycan lipid II flippase